MTVVNSLKMSQCKPIENNDALKEHTVIPEGSTVIVQRENGRPWTCGSIVEHGDEHSGCFYRI